MSSEMLAKHLGLISTDLIQEAIESRREKRLHFTDKFWRIAACFFFLFISAAVLTTAYNSGLFVSNDTDPIASENEPFTPMSFSEIESSKYADFVPDLTGLGYRLDGETGVYGERTFQIRFILDEYPNYPQIGISVSPFSEGLDQDRLFDMNAPDRFAEIKYPIFFADQFNMDCMDYITVTTTATGLIVTQFWILKDGLVATYNIDAFSLEEVTTAIERICLCFN